MRKLEIDYDFIDKIYESEGKYKIKRFMMEDFLIFDYKYFLILANHYM